MKHEFYSQLMVVSEAKQTPLGGSDCAKCPANYRSLMCCLAKMTPHLKFPARCNASPRNNCDKKICRIYPLKEEICNK